MGSQNIPFIIAPSLKIKIRLLKVVANEWRQMVSVLRRKERAVVTNTSRSSGVLQGPPKPGELGVRYVNRSPYAYCGKKHNGVECGCNTTHSTKFHKKWAAEGTVFNLASECPSHELVLESNTGSSKPKSTMSLLLESLPLPTMLSYMILSRPCLVR